MHVGNGGSQATVFGTPNRVYSMYGWACGIGCTVDPGLESAAVPGMSGWTSASAPGMTQGPGAAAVVFNGSQYIVVTANWTAGLWRFAEPSSGVPSVLPAATSVPAPANTPTALPTTPPIATPMITPVAAPTNTPVTPPTNTPIAAPTKQLSVSYASSSNVTPDRLARGNSVTITASVASSPGSSALVDVEFYDPSGKKVFQKYWDNQSFVGGQPRTYTTTWIVPGSAATGSYTVKIGVFKPGWSSLLYWNNGASSFSVN